jgi:hypothetical protein
MNEVPQLCICKDSPSPAEFACNCGVSVILLCKLCVISHLREPKAHLFLTIEQGIKILQSDSEFNKQFSAGQKQFIELKSAVTTYLSKLVAFTSQLEATRNSLISALNSEFDSKMEILRRIQADAVAKTDLINQNLSASDFSLLQRYAENGLRSILESYPQEFEVYQNRVREGIENMIYIGDCKRNEQEIEGVNEVKAIEEKNTENTKCQEMSLKVKEVQERLEVLQAQNEKHLSIIRNYEISEEEHNRKISELKEKVNQYRIENEEYINRLCIYEKRDEEYNLRGSELEHDCSYEVDIKEVDITPSLIFPLNLRNSQQSRSLLEECKSQAASIYPSFSYSNLSDISENRYVFFSKRYTRALYRYDPDSDDVTFYDLSKYTSSKFLRTSCCILPDGCILIVGGCNPSIGTTLKFNPCTLKCTNLNDLITSRAYITLFVYEDYVYAFGGQREFGKEALNKAERMKWRGNSWKMLEDMKKARSDFGCFGYNGKIYLMGGRNTSKVEYFDTREMRFYIVNGIKLPLEPSFAWESGDRVYIFSRNKKLTFSKNLRLISRHYLEQSLVSYYFSNKVSRDSKLYFYSDFESKIYSVNYQSNQVSIVKDFA